MSLRSEEFLVGAVALLLVPLIARRIYRGIREGRLPLYRASMTREEGGAARFNLLLLLHAMSLVLVLVVAADLLLGLGIRERL